MSALLYGFDTSLAHFGYAVAELGPEGLRFLVAGVLVTKPTPQTGPVKLRPTITADTRRRCTWLATALRGVIARHGAPTLIGVEAVALMRGQTTLTTVSALGRSRGLVDSVAAEHACEVREFGSQTLKKLITGNRSAEKADVITAITRRYPELEALFAQLAPANVEHAADAAASLHAAHTQENHHAEAFDEAD